MTHESSSTKPTPFEHAETATPDSIRSFHESPTRNQPFFLSFKNRILFSTLVVLVGGIILIALVLQFAVFPTLIQAGAAVVQLKLFHLIASLVLIGISWLFIEIVSKRITLPLKELTEHADQISREAGHGGFLRSLQQINRLPEGEDEPFQGPPTGDEIQQLTHSFYRMLHHLRASERRLRESEAKYRFLFDNAPCSMLVVDPDAGTILDVNARAELEYQYTAQELVGKKFSELVADEERDGIGSVAEIVAAGEGSAFRVLRHRRRDGSHFLVNIHARLSRFKDSSAIIAAVWDVTERSSRRPCSFKRERWPLLGRWRQASRTS
ncbi:MAG: PAS domain S-box protein [Pseudomonadota bacterium]